MRKRILNPAPAERTAFGLIAWLEQTKITLPLKDVECDFQVCGDVVSVELDQVFHQDNDRPLNCTYSFPLPAGAAVYRCEMHVNGRVIRARVEERERARELAREKKAAGYRTTLVEMERENLFTLSLGNVQPGDVIVIRFAWFQALTRLGDWTSFRIPFCPGVRYIPGTPLLRAPRGRGVADDTDQVPDASRISPPRIDRLHPDAARLSISGKVEHPLDDVKDISSPTHPVLVRPGRGVSEVSLADRAAVPDADFLLRWTETEAEQVRPMGWLSRDHEDTFVLVRLRAPAQVSTTDDYAQDIYFLVDRSGSMSGLKWQKAAEAFREFVRVLGPNDRVWATFFESTFRDLAEQPLPAKAVLADANVQNLEKLGAAGGTELLPALEHVVAKVAQHSANRPAALVLITDGEVGNEAEILKHLARHPQLRVHVFGIDATINDAFLGKLAAQHHGTSCLMSPQDDIVGAVARLGDRLRRPVLTSIRIPRGWEIAGQECPDLHAGEVLMLALKATTSCSSASDRKLALEASLPDGATKAYEFELTETDAAALPLLWYRRRIDFLLAQGHSADAIALAKKANLVCDGAAFIAWDEAEKVPVSGPEDELYQPALDPMRYRKCSSVSISNLVAMRLAAEPFLNEATDAYISAAPGKRFTERLQDWFQHAPSSREADLFSATRAWNREIQGNTLFQNQAGEQLLRLLLAWADASRQESEGRVVRLRELLEQLRLAGPRVAERLDLLRGWIEKHLEGDPRRQALELVRQLEAAALPASPGG